MFGGYIGQGLVSRPAHTAVDGDQVGQILRVHQRLADVLMSVTGNRAEVRVNGVHVLDSRGKAVTQKLLCALPGRAHWRFRRRPR